MIGVLISGPTFGLMAGLVSAAFLGYCFYFDRRRRSHPDFKKNLYERRRQNQKHEELVGVPIAPNQQSVEQYFLREIRNGERAIVEGNFDRGSDHLLNAIAICNKPGQLISILQKNLPVEVFSLLLEKLKKYYVNSQGQPAGNGHMMAGLLTDDVSVE